MSHHNTTPVKIGVISDTHIPDRLEQLPATALGILADAKLILHAGDIITPEVLEQLETIAPTVAVAGNNHGDVSNFSDSLLQERIIVIGNWKIGLTHGHTDNLFLRLLEWFLSSILHQGWITNQIIVHRIRPRFPEVDCIIFGHSHTPYIGWHQDILFFNPGSPVNQPAKQSVGILEVRHNGLHPFIKSLQQNAGKNSHRHQTEVRS